MTTKANLPVTAGSIAVPYGHVIGNEKWRGSEIAQRLQEHWREAAQSAVVGVCGYASPLNSLGFTAILCYPLAGTTNEVTVIPLEKRKVRLIFEDGLGLVDFHLSNRTCILLISEADLVAGDEFKRRLVRFRNASSLKGIVIVEKTPISDQYYSGVQKLVVLELGMVLLPVANQGEASQLIIQLVREQSRDRGANPFARRQRAPPAEPAVLRAVQHIPGVGRTKALLLLQRFGSIRGLCNASVSELEQVVGQTVAQQIYTFLHS